MDLNIDTQRAIGKHARDFRASKRKVEAPAEKPSKTTDKIREAQEMEAIVRNEQAVAADAEALIKQRKLLEGVDVDEFVVKGIVEESPVEGITADVTEEIVGNLGATPLKDVKNAELEEFVEKGIGVSEADVKKGKLIKMFEGVGQKLADAFDRFKNK